MSKLKIIFAGTDNFSAQYLHALIQYKYNIIAVITKPDQLSGRGQKKHFSPVKILSIKHHIPIVQPKTLNNKYIHNQILNFKANIMIVVSYGNIIPTEILIMFSRGCINVHPSLLPKWRGPTPIQSAILFNEKKTGVSIIKMNNKVDSGNIIHTLQCKISSQDTTQTLSEKLIYIGIRALLESLKKIQNNTVSEKKQNSKNATFSKKISKHDALINWNMEASFLERLIRAFNPWPICYFVISNIIIRIWKASVIPIVKPCFSTGKIICCNKYGIQVTTKNKILNIEKIQFPGKKITHVKTLSMSKRKFFLSNKII